MAHCELPGQHAHADEGGRRGVGRPPRRLRSPRPKGVARAHGGARLHGADLAAGIRRRRPFARGGAGARRGDARARMPPAAHELRRLDAGAGAARVRQRGAKARAHARRSCAARSAGVRATASPAPAPTWPACRRAPCVDGDDYVVNGHKIWTSLRRPRPTGCSAWCAPTRARPSTRASRFLLIDMASPGITVRPIRLISGNSPFCETFFDDVRVPRKNLVGQPGGGLDHRQASACSTSARSSPKCATTSPTKRRSNSVARRYIGAAAGPLADAALRDRIAQANMDFHCNKITLRRSAEAAEAGRGPAPSRRCSSSTAPS